MKNRDDLYKYAFYGLLSVVKSKSMAGKLIKKHGKLEILECLSIVSKKDPIDKKAYLIGTLNARSKETKDHGRSFYDSVYGLHGEIFEGTTIEGSGDAIQTGSGVEGVLGGRVLEFKSNVQSNNVCNEERIKIIPKFSSNVVGIHKASKKLSSTLFCEDYRQNTEKSNSSRYKDENKGNIVQQTKEKS